MSDAESLHPRVSSEVFKVRPEILQVSVSIEQQPSVEQGSVMDFHSSNACICYIPYLRSSQDLQEAFQRRLPGHRSLDHDPRDFCYLANAASRALCHVRTRGWNGNSDAQSHRTERDVPTFASGDPRHVLHLAVERQTLVPAVLSKATARSGPEKTAYLVVVCTCVRNCNLGDLYWRYPVSLSFKILPMDYR